MSINRKAATDHTRAANSAARGLLPEEEPQDFADARHGLVAPLDPGPIRAADGRVVWDHVRFAAFQGEDAPCPDSVHPSLWRQARLNTIGGLFQVCPGVHQLRGLDLSNMTLIEGRTGRIVVDPLISAECAAAGLDLAARHLGERPIAALIYTHSHADHFGGSEALRARTGGHLEIVAPDRFLEFAVSENILAGPAMRRRAVYMYGSALAADAKGIVDAGLGKTTSVGRVGLLPPTRLIRTDGETMTIDGVDFVFQLAPETEAPAEMMFYLPTHRALNVADNACAGLHNLYTLRGAEVRDARAWSRALDIMLNRFADRTDVLFGGHHWPRFGAARIRDYLTAQRDAYQFIHDQTLRLINNGLTPREIAETLRLPKSIACHWYVRDYYGTVAHNAKAVYQKYLGWFDGHPANLHPLPPAQSGPLYVEFMGGPDALMTKARKAFAGGQYRFVAEVLAHLVFADPEREDARALQADALEQLGYQAESAAWRNVYLTGARELREPVAGRTAAAAPVPISPLAAMLPVTQIFDALAVALDASAAEDKTLTIAWQFTDGDGVVLMRLENAVLRHWPGRDEPADVRITLTRKILLDLLARHLDLPAAMATGALVIEGDGGRLSEFFSLFRQPDPRFAIVTP